MKYSKGELGRVFVARVEHSDDLLDELKQLVQVFRAYSLLIPNLKGRGLTGCAKINFK